MFLEKNLKYLRRKAGLSQEDIAKKFGYKSFTTIQKWESGASEPSVSVVKALSEMYGVSLNDIVHTDLELTTTDNEAEEELINTYRELSTENKTKLVDYSTELLEGQTSIKENNGLYSVEVIEAVAAGLGYRYGNNESTIYYTDRSDLKHYDYATLVTGDSMYPTYNDGDIVLVRSGYDNVNGDVYVIDYDGKSYVKKLYNDGDRFRLVSINRDYDNIIIDIPIADGAYFNIIGKVVDSFTPIEL